MKRKTKQFIAAFHWILGLIILIPLLVASISGTALVFREELENYFEPELYLVEPSETLSSVDELSMVVNRYSGASISYLAIPEQRNRSWQFVLRDNSILFVNPYTSDVLGRQHIYSGSTGWLYDLHSNLFSGRTGEVVLGVVGIAVLLLFASGLLVWIKRQQPFRNKFRFKISGSHRRRVFDLHKLSGVILGILLALSALTGSALIFYGTFSQFTYGLAGREAPEYPVAPADKNYEFFSPDRAFAVAKNSLPEAVIKRIVWPTTGNRVAQIRFRQQQEVHPNGMSFVYIDSKNYSTLSVHKADDVPVTAKMNHWLYPLHSGKWVRWWDMVLLLTGIGGILLTVSGFLNVKNMKW